MKTFKSIMRGIVSAILFMAIFVGLGILTGEEYLSVDSFFGALMWTIGTLIMSAVVWGFLVWFIIWLTDGKWELDEEESKRGLDEEEESEWDLDDKEESEDED